MRLMRQIIAEVIEVYPNDDFFSKFEVTLQYNVQARKIYAAYEQALRVLDEQSLKTIKQKAINHFQDHRDGQRKQGFFNQLNEAFAYKYLVEHGNSKVRIVPENGKKVSDIEFVNQGAIRSCEVKTIGRSDEEVFRPQDEVYSDAVYTSLNGGYFRKLNSAISMAESQVSAHHGSGLIYLILFFDDFTLRYYATYRKQIQKALSRHDASNIYAKVEILGRRRITKGNTYAFQVTTI